MTTRYLCILAMAFTMLGCHEDLDQRAYREAREHTAKNCPMVIAPGITNDSLTYDRQTRTVSYYFTLGKDIDAGKINGSLARQELQTEIINATNLRLYKDAGFNFRYVYMSEKSGDAIVFDFLFTPKDYRK